MKLLFLGTAALVVAAAACGGDTTVSNTSTGAGGTSNTSSGSGGTASGSGGTSTGNGGSSTGGSGSGGGSSFACGDMGLVCDPGEVCAALHATAGPTTTTTYECDPDPCAPNALDCSCAGAICQAAFGLILCMVDQNDVVNCDNGAQ